MNSETKSEQFVIESGSVPSSENVSAMVPSGIADTDYNPITNTQQKDDEEYYFDDFSMDEDDILSGLGAKGNTPQKYDPT